jgi:hypothetical protein
VKRRENALPADQIYKDRTGQKKIPGKKDKTSLRLSVA